MSDLRCFIAVDVPEPVRRRLTYLSRELDSRSIIPVKEQSIHITLKFLGDVAQNKIPLIESKLENIKTGSFKLKLREIGAFPNENYVRVVWVGCENESLRNLGKLVNDRLEGIFPKEEFTPHVTVARVKGKIDFKEFAKKYHGQTFGEFNVHSFSLKTSQLTSAGPKYLTVSEFEL